MKILNKSKIMYALALCLSAAGGGAIATAKAEAVAAPSDKSQISALSKIEVEKTAVGADGNKSISYMNPANTEVVPGDKLKITLMYANNGDSDVSGFDAVNPIREEFEFISVEQDWALVSVDGGKNWGKLAELTVPAVAADGSPTTRNAIGSDVTHVRWKISDPITPSATGELVFYAFLR